MYRPATSHCDDCGKEHWPPVRYAYPTKVYCARCEGEQAAGRMLAKFRERLARPVSDRPADETLREMEE